MRKLLIVLSTLAMFGWFNIVHVKAEEPIVNTKELKAFCESKASLIQKVLFGAVDYNHELHNMLREDVADFVPALFAQFKMENECILLYSVLVELMRTGEQGEVFSITIMLLDQYIELLRYGMLKAKMFEGMLKDPTKWFDISTDRLMMSKVAVNLKVAHDLLVDIKKGLEELK